MTTKTPAKPTVPTAAAVQRQVDDYSTQIAALDTRITELNANIAPLEDNVILSTDPASLDSLTRIKTEITILAARRAQLAQRRAEATTEAERLAVVDGHRERLAALVGDIDALDAIEKGDEWAKVLARFQELMSRRAALRRSIRTRQVTLNHPLQMRHADGQGALIAQVADELRALEAEANAATGNRLKSDFAQIEGY